MKSIAPHFPSGYGEKNKSKDKTKINQVYLELLCFIRNRTKKQAAEIWSNLNLKGQLQDGPFFCVVYVLHEKMTSYSNL